MKRLPRWGTMEEFVVRDGNFVFTIVSYVMVSLIFVNQMLIFSAVLGAVTSVVFFFINALFVGWALFRGENAFFRFVLGSLVLLLLLGIVGWLVMIAYNLDVLRSAIALCILAGCSSLMNRLKKKV